MDAPDRPRPTFEIRSIDNYHEDLLANWPSHWPPKENRVYQHDVTPEHYEGFAALLELRAGERSIEQYLAKNREVLSMAIWMFATGHHMSWLFPKTEIRPAIGSAGGLIPDYLMAGANSDGVSWFVLELKGADKNAFVKDGKRIYLSSDTNKGICQLMNYLDYCARDQAYLRDGLELVGMREPRGILLIGTEEETEDPQMQAFKQAWNRMNPRLQIRSYHALLRQLGTKLRDHRRLPG